jgi:hypothetical protein
VKLFVLLGGLYTVAGEVDTNAIALAIEKKTGERLGKALINPSTSTVMIPTSGLSRTVVTGGHQIQFRRMSQRKIQLSQTAKGLVLLDLWNRGMKDLTTMKLSAPQAIGHRVRLTAMLR